MINDKFLNWFMIIVPLLVSIGMFKHGVDYFWLPYIVSLIALARYTDFLESKEREQEAVPFPISKHLDDTGYRIEEYGNDGDLFCKECNYVYDACVCKPIVN